MIEYPSFLVDTICVICAQNTELIKPQMTQIFTDVTGVGACAFYLWLSVSSVVKNGPSGIMVDSEFLPAGSHQPLTKTHCDSASGMRQLPGLRFQRVPFSDGRTTPSCFEVAHFLTAKRWQHVAHGVSRGKTKPAQPKATKWRQQSLLSPLRGFRFRRHQKPRVHTRGYMLSLLRS